MINSKVVIKAKNQYFGKHKKYPRIITITPCSLSELMDDGGKENYTETVDKETVHGLDIVLSMDVKDFELSGGEKWHE